MELCLAPLGPHAALLKPLSLRAGAVHHLNRYAVVQRADSDVANFISHSTHATLRCHSSGDAVDLCVAHRNGVKIGGVHHPAGSQVTLQAGTQLCLPSCIDRKHGWGFRFVLRQNVLGPLAKRPRLEDTSASLGESLVDCTSRSLNSSTANKSCNAEAAVTNVATTLLPAPSSQKRPSECPCACKETAQSASHLQVAHRPKSPAHAAPTANCLHFGGDRIYLNRLEPSSSGLEAPYANKHCYMPEVHRTDLLAPLGNLVRALFTSYGTDYQYLAELLRDSPASTLPNGITVVDNYEHHFYRPGIDQHKYTTNNVGANISVVLPPFYERDASAADRSRVRYGTMHPKLWLLCFNAGKTNGEGFLRVVVSSANLGRYDSEINNQTWVCDFPLQAAVGDKMASLEAEQLAVTFETGGVRMPGGVDQSVLYRLLQAWRSGEGDVTPSSAARHNQTLNPVCGSSDETARLESEPSSSDESHRGHNPSKTGQSHLLPEADGEFGADLLRFVRSLLAEASAELHGVWRDTLNKYCLVPPAGTHLIISVPGRWSFDKDVSADACGQRRRGGLPSISEAELYGQIALKRHLREALHGRASKDRPSRVEYAISSLGSLEVHSMPHGKCCLPMLLLSNLTCVHLST